ncbi:ABC transporter permease, partial [Candidatus Sumerlaeota bacterium]|nr:ABC transporter permease [Candidatus Sumerlaeota bacterium]
MTQIWITVKVALKNLRSHKLRSFLTTLGIIIGVASVIALMALGNGASNALTTMIRGFGSNVMMLMPNYRSSGGVYLDYVERLTVEDARALMDEVPELAAASPMIGSTVQLKYGNRNIRTSLQGVSGSYLKMMNLTLTAGRTFTHREVESRQKVLIAGSQVIEDFFGGNPEAAIGRLVKINGIGYRVVGALEKKGGPENPDKNVLAPYSTVMRRVVGTNYVHQITLQGFDEETTEEAIRGITRVMRRRHNLRPDKEDDFQIFSFEDALETMQASTLIFTALLAGIASISLLVGGIGIMNIMLVTVTERTGEIGMRKALGAKRRDIMAQFLIESVVVSLVGGGLGVALGAALASGF